METLESQDMSSVKESMVRRDIVSESCKAMQSFRFNHSLRLDSYYRSRLDSQGSCFKLEDECCRIQISRPF